jgi:GTP cyclohydrolase I
MTVFENESEGIDQIVGLNDIEFYSFCEHHMLPFF